MSFQDGRIEGGGLGYEDARPGPIDAATGAVSLGIRSEHIGIVAEDSGEVDSRVDLRESLCGDSHLYVATATGDRVVVRAEGDTTLDAGARIGLVLPTARVRQFGADGRTLRSGCAAA